MIAESDLGQSFFYAPEDLGKPRAEVMCANLLELNPDDVQGNFVVQPIKDFIQTNWEDGFDLVIATNVDNEIALAVSEKARAKQVPVMLIRQYGLIGYIRIISNEVCVAEQKPYQVELQDLRLNAPFEELLAFANTFDLPSLPLESHSHVPYVVLLLQAMEAWKNGHDGKKPSGFAEKAEFKELIKGMALEFEKEVNFSEALKNAYFVHQSTDLPFNVQDIFEMAKIDDNNEKDPFWVCCSALKKFYEVNKRLPVSGTIPDMTAHTDSYLAMQKVYVDKAAEDLKQCQQILEDVCQERGLDASSAEYQEKLIVACKNAQYLQITMPKSFKEELDNFTPPEEFQWSLADPEECHAWYIACRCFEDFRVANGRCPG